jgi:hypothetical protein
MYYYELRLPGHIFQTYLLLVLSIGSYLIGAYTMASFGLSIFAIFLSFMFLFLVVTIKVPIMLIMFAFMIGVSHNPLFMYLNFIDPTIITEVLVATLLVFVGLTIIAFNTVYYSTFAVYGFLYTSLSTMMWLCLLNFFFKNGLFDMLLMYFSIVLFTGFIIVDTHDMLKNTTDGPVHHATQLFLDFINVFIGLVKLLRHLKKKD